MKNRKAGKIDIKYLDPECKELSCTSEELLEFQNDALQKYSSNIIPLPPNLSLHNPFVLLSDNQKKL